MMDSVRIENEAGDVFRLEDYGMLLKSFDAKEPAVKAYREEIDGADGDLDMTEWAGIIRYKTRKVQFVVRDMANRWWRDLVDFCHGRNIKITHSSDEEHYFFGRCETSHTTREHVTDVTLTVTCQPYRLSHLPTTITQAVTDSAEIVLVSARMPVAPKITVSATMVLIFDGMTVTLQPGTYTVPNFVVTSTPKTLEVTGTGQITLVWVDGVI